MPPTAQNLRRIEEDLWSCLPRLLDLDDAQIAWRAEQAVRIYDPCIPCATHFLRVDIRRGPA